ncbi:MAG: AAA family ATPase [Candidatus Micrarchaeota archaeon]
MLIIVCGLPGSGKSTLAKLISKHYSAVYLSSDIIRKEIFLKPKYSDDEKEKVYSEMAGQTEQILLEGNKVVVDATFYKAEQRGTFLTIAKDLDKKTFIIFCSLDENEVKKRIEKRKKGPSDATFEVYLKLKKEFEPITQKYLEVNVWNKRDLLKKIVEFVG